MVKTESVVTSDWVSDWVSEWVLEKKNVGRLWKSHNTKLSNESTCGVAGLESWPPLVDGCITLAKKVPAVLSSGSAACDAKKRGKLIAMTEDYGNDRRWWPWSVGRVGGGRGSRIGTVSTKGSSRKIRLLFSHCDQLSCLTTDCAVSELDCD